MGVDATGNASGQCPAGLWALSEKNGVAHGSGDFLSPSGKLVGSVADSPSGIAAGDSLAGGLVAGSKVSLSGGGVVLVSGNVVPGQRSCSSRWTGHGRPIYLHSLDGSIHHHGLGWGGHDAP